MSAPARAIEPTRFSYMSTRQYRERAEQQRLRLIELLEALADEEHQEQCDGCGAFFERLSSHTPHCDGVGE